MSITSLRERIESLPLVLAGPVVRRVEPEAVTVWVALRRPREVCLRVFSLAPDGEQEIMSGTRTTEPLGEHLHLVAVTATGATPLLRGQIYSYEMTFADLEGECREDGLFTPGVVHADEESARAALRYENGPARPSFVVPPDSIEELRIVHGSCRRPNRGGADAMPVIDRLIAREPGAPGQRPHLLFLTGDNIYADDNQHPKAYLDLISDTADVLLGWREYLPGYECHVNDLPIDARHGRPDRKMGHPEPSLLQLFSLGEYMAMSLLVMSEVLWPDDFPEHGDTSAIIDMVRTLPLVRRALANISTGALFDDHEVSDDWNLNLYWCEQVYEKPLGRRVVQNALTAFALIHTWGDRPSAFARAADGARPGWRLLQLLRDWRPTQPTGEALPEELELWRILSIPESAAALTAHGEPARLWHHPDALDWHFQITAGDYQILALDVRTWRAFPGATSLSMPDLLSAEALRAQVPTTEPGSFLATILISPIPLLAQSETWVSRAAAYLNSWYSGLRGWLRGHTTIRKKLVFGCDDGDMWLRDMLSFSGLIDRLHMRRRIVVLSGDVHFAYAARMTVGTGDRGAVFAQLTSSGMLSEKPIMRYWQRYGYNQPWPWYKLPKPVKGWLADSETPYRIEYLRANIPGREGREVVSNNNIGEVLFSTRDGRLVVTQHTWWRAESDGEMAPRTPFEIVFDVDDEESDTA